MGAHGARETTLWGRIVLYRSHFSRSAALAAGFAARLAHLLQPRPFEERDILSMNAHLRRDLGLGDGELGVRPHDIWRK